MRYISAIAEVHAHVLTQFRVSGATHIATRRSSIHRTAAGTFTRSWKIGSTTFYFCVCVCVCVPSGPKSYGGFGLLGQDLRRWIDGCALPMSFDSASFPLDDLNRFLTDSNRFTFTVSRYKQERWQVVYTWKKTIEWKSH